MKTLVRLRNWRARRALRRAVRLAGADVVAQWVLDGALPAGESCPFGCSGELLDLKQQLADVTRERDYYRGGVETGDHLFRTLVDAVTKAGGLHAQGPRG